jgi:hypothetical protein
MSQEFAISAAALADTWRSNTDADPEQRRFCIKQYQGAAAYHAGYTAPAQPLDLYREALAREYRSLSEWWASLADTMRTVRTDARHIRNANNAVVAYAFVADTLLDPDYWIEH